MKLLLYFTLVFPFIIYGQESINTYPLPGKACLACHQGVEPIREHQSKMMRAIYREGKTMGNPNGCIVCHYGNPQEEVTRILRTRI